jgi:hypothetical protein
MPSARNTSSNSAVNLLSRSRIRNLNEPARSPSSIIKFLACWAAQPAVGFAVTPRMCTRRVAYSTTAKQYSRASVIVSA